MKPGSFFLGLVLLLPVMLFPYVWEHYAAENIAVNSYSITGGGLFYEVICTENGIIVNDENYSYYSMPCWEAIQIMGTGDELLVVMGDGTDSDGIYGLDLDTGSFSIYMWLLNPRFIRWCPADSSYYAGGEEGLFRSSDGIFWEPVSDFNMLYCYDMAIYDCNYIIGAYGSSWYSHNAGETWTQNPIQHPFTDLEYNSNGCCYAIFPDGSYSSGLYSSTDFGENWEVEFWATNMTSVNLSQELPFVGWKCLSGTYQGIASWEPMSEELTFYNNGLGNLMINSITTNPLINTPNVICCTDNGVWMLTSFTTDSENNALPDNNIACNYPNPFNPETEIHFNLNSGDNAEIIITDLKGRVVKRDVLANLTAGEHSYCWQGRDNEDKNLPSGVYYYFIKLSERNLAGKMVMLK